MTRVVNNKHGGTGTTAFSADVVVAGKTGTAQAARFLIPAVDDAGLPIIGEDGRPMREPLRPSTHDRPNPTATWYRAIDKEGEKLNHAWFIGFAPADHPKIALSVMVEYGGGGGGAVAGPIANRIIKALIEHGYLHPRAMARTVD
jgi:cell division protein FtsI/penicillin-binding protein 2